MALRALLLFPALAASAAPARAQQSAPDAGSGTIVVTGVPIQETEARLRACIARHCPADEDALAALAHAENQFVAGDYRGARNTLDKAAHRDKRRARQYPVIVSDLLRAKARVQINLGDSDGYRSSLFDSLDAAKAGLPDGDPHVLIARLELGDAQVSLGQYDLADALYRRSLAEARRAHLPMIEGHAMLRRASLLAQRAAAGPGDRAAAIRAMDELIASPEPAHAVFALAARVLKARLYAREGDTSAIDTIIADMHTQRAEAPILLYAPALDIPPKIAGAIVPNENKPAWVDVAFWITPQGMTADVDYVRHSPSFRPDWAAPILASIRGRRYVPLRIDPNAPGRFRVERYTLVHRRAPAELGTRIRTVERGVHVEYVDLSARDAGIAATGAPQPGSE